MTHNSKNALTMMTFLCFITVIGYSQAADSLKAATIEEKAEAIIHRMERELSLTKMQSKQLQKVLTERFQALKQPGADNATLETANRNAQQELKAILNREQYALYQELQLKRKRAKEKYLKEHPGFAFSKEDLEMDF